MSVDRLINTLIAPGHGANVILEKSYSLDSSCAKFPLSFTHKNPFQIMQLFTVTSELSALQFAVVLTQCIPSDMSNFAIFSFTVKWQLTS